MYFQTYFSKILNVFLLHRSIILCTTIFRTFLILQIPLRQLAIWKLYSACLIFDQIVSHTQISGKVSTEKKKQLIVKTVLWQLVLSFQPLDQVILTRITSHCRLNKNCHNNPAINMSNNSPIICVCDSPKDILTGKLQSPDVILVGYGIKGYHSELVGL